jgi:hypothetical protein
VEVFNRGKVPEEQKTVNKLLIESDEVRATTEYEQRLRDETDCGLRRQSGAKEAILNTIGRCRGKWQSTVNRLLVNDALQLKKML